MINKKYTCDHCLTDKCRSGICDVCGKDRNCLIDIMDPYNEITGEENYLDNACEYCVESRREQI